MTIITITSIANNGTYFTFTLLVRESITSVKNF